jgi:hypothetical protein
MKPGTFQRRRRRRKSDEEEKKEDNEKKETKVEEKETNPMGLVLMMYDFCLQSPFCLFVQVPRCRS